jgi:membrane protease YdiL (CAAX protease family)
VTAVSSRATVGALAFALLFPSLFTWVYFVALAGAPGGLQQTVYGTCKTIQFLFPIVWLLAVERKRRDGMPSLAQPGSACRACSPDAARRESMPPGMAPLRPGTAGLAAGVIFGAIILAAIVVLYHLWFKPEEYHGLWFKAGKSLASARQEIRDKLVQFGVGGPLGYVVLAAFYSVVHSFLEEYYWRWFVFGRLRDLMGWKTAVVVASVGFMGHHVIVLGTFCGWLSPATWVFSLAVGLGGAFWAWLYHRSRSLLGPWASHLLIDAAIFVVGYDLAGPL